MLHIEGFEQFGSENALTEALIRSGYEAVGAWASVAGRGQYSRAISAQGASVTRTFAWNEPKFSLGFAHMFEDRGSVAWLKIGTFDITLSLDKVDGLPRLGTTVGGALPVKSRWYFFELEVERSTGSVALYINGRFDCIFVAGPGSPIQGANQIKASIGTRPPSEYIPGSTANDLAVKSYDDMYMRTDARFSPIMVTTRFPTTDQLVEWQKAGTDPTHAATVSRRPPTPLDNYIASDTVGKRDRFTSSQPLSNSLNVIAMGIVVLARKSPSVTARLGVEVGGSVVPRDDRLTVDTDWHAQYVCFEDNVDESPANVVASTFGVSVTN